MQTVDHQIRWYNDGNSDMTPYIMNAERLNQLKAQLILKLDYRVMQIYPWTYLCYT